MNHNPDFIGKWITTAEFAELSPRNVFHRQLDKLDLPCDEHRNRHILYRADFTLDSLPTEATMRITADDYYKLYINGLWVGQGPAPTYHFQYGYNTYNVLPFLKPGRNVVAIHTLYQGLINRVWQSGDQRHGMICDLYADGSCILSSSASFRTAYHTAYKEEGTTGYQTQFLETYDSRAAECLFMEPDFDDSGWLPAVPKTNDDHVTVMQNTPVLETEVIKPVILQKRNQELFVDFGTTAVGYLVATAKGPTGESITVRLGQELTQAGEVQYELRANCHYEEQWILSGNTDRLDWFDYKSFRYASLLLPKETEIIDIYLLARHYPFQLTAKLKPSYRGDPSMESIWSLCVNTLRLGVQEVIQDCMEREKGFYLGDGCYTSLAHMILTGDDRMARKLIDDAFSASFITPGLVTCMDCSFMQEIAEYPLIMVYLIWWHYRLTGDMEYLEQHYQDVIALLESYRRDYEREYLLSHLDKWCVVEWPKNFQDGYDVDITEGKICEEAHVSINAYYLEAIHTANRIADVLGKPAFRDTKPMVKAFYQSFYDFEEHLFCDGEHSRHKSYIGNIFPFAYHLCPDNSFEENMRNMIASRKASDLSFFGTFALLQGLCSRGDQPLLDRVLHDDGAWLRMLREGATTTFEGWGKDTKWNTSLFHLTMSDVAVFLADIDQFSLFSRQ